MKLQLYIALFVPFLSYGQDTIQPNWSLNGYITNMQTFTFQHWDGDWTSDNLIHNRLNFKWHNTPNTLNAVVEVRNRFLSGESVKLIPDYGNIISYDNGLINLSDNLSKGKNYIFNSKIDRAYIDYTKDKFQLRVGRQRINWGQCFTWNPNDLFNAYSFFDFDYPERPGSDAVRLQYYLNSTSSLDMAVKSDRNHNITSAALYHFNKWNYDIQFLAGTLNQEDLVIGTGWSGNIAGASFRGEISYFHPQKHFNDSTGFVVVSLGSEYSFKNSFVLQFEGLYNQNNKTGITSFTDYFNKSLFAKTLSFSKLSFMLQGSYPVTPLFNVSLAGMYFLNPNGYFIGPTLTYSITDNIEFSLISESFVGQITKGNTEHFQMGVLRLKWNF